MEALEDMLVWYVEDAKNYQTPNHQSNYKTNKPTKVLVNDLGVITSYCLTRADG